MTVYHHNLNFKIDLLKNSTNITDLPNIVNGKKAYHSSVSIKDHINPEMIDFLAELNIFSNHCELFYSTPYFFSGIHVDVNHGDFTKINWVFGGANSLMNWYTPKNKISQSKQTLSSAINSPYIGYNIEEVELLHSSPLGFPSLVQVGIPHNIVNSTEDRYCISLVLGSVKNRKLYRPTMQQSLDMLSKYLGC